jgi:colanic acid/amylovoran biosynthesis glycosyltransferase
LRVITVARLVEMKGIEFGIRAAARAAQSGLAVDYAIAGDGVLRQDLERLACALGVSESVHFLGALDGAQVARALCEADLFLCPSIVDSDGLEEGVPVAVMEAMAAGLPIVGSCLDGIAELVADGVTGFLTPPRDVGAIATRLEELIAHPALLVDMGERGRERVRREFDIERLNDRLVELYSQVANTYTLAERMRHASVL